MEVISDDPTMEKDSQWSIFVISLSHLLLSLCVYSFHLLLLLCVYSFRLLLSLCVYSFHLQAFIMCKLSFTSFQYVYSFHYLPFPIMSFTLTMWLCEWEWLVMILKWEITHNDPLFKSFHYVFIAFTMWFIDSFLSLTEV